MRRKTRYILAGTIEELTQWLKQHSEELEEQQATINLDFITCSWFLKVIY